MKPGQITKSALQVVLQDAVTNVIYFVGATGGILLIGSWSRRFGIVLAAIEAVCATLQSFKTLLTIVATIVTILAVVVGKQKWPEDESEIRWGTLIRFVELVIWIGCLFVLYRFFFKHTSA